jgi:hypothetical protein
VTEESLVLDIAAHFQLEKWEKVWRRSWNAIDCQKKMKKKREVIECRMRDSAVRPQVSDEVEGVEEVVAADEC